MRLRERFSKLRSDLGVQLLALYMLFVIPVVVGGLVFDQIAAERIGKDIKDADLALARAIAQETDTFISTALKSVEQLSSYPEVIQEDVEGMDSLFGNVYSVRPDVNLIYRLDETGLMIYHYPVHNPSGAGSTVGWDFSFRDYFQKALTMHEPLVSKGRKSPTTEQPVATAVMPMWDGDEFLGLVATNIMLTSLSDTLASIVKQEEADETLNVMIIDAEGQVIAHPDAEMLLLDLNEGLPSVSRMVLGGRTGSLILKEGQGEERLFSYVPVTSAGWGVIVSRPTAVAFATPRAFHRGVLLMIGVFLGIGLFFWIALSVRVLQPLERLAAYSQRLGQKGAIRKEDLDPLRKYSERPDQLGHLIRSFARMEAAIQARITELSTLLKTSAAVVSTLDSQTVLNRILEQVEHLMDVQICAVVALDEQRNVFRVQASRGLSKRYADQLAISPDEHASVTMRAIRSGEPVQISDTETNPSYTAFRPRARAEGFRSILAIPLNTPHTPPAALLVYGKEPHTYDENEINLLSSFANHAAMAIENATLFARSDAKLQEQSRRLEALVESLEDGLILEDLQGRVLYANRRISELSGVPHEEINGTPAEHLLEGMLSHADENVEDLEALNVRLGDGEAEDVEIALDYPSGKRFMRLKGFKVMEKGDLSIGRGLFIQDVTRSRELDRMKSSLVSTVSHELRTPLAAIKGYASTLLAEDVHWELKAQREFLTIISEEVDRLSELVNTLLDMSRIEAGNLAISKVPCDLKELARRGAERVKPGMSGQLDMRLGKNLPEVCADPQRIESVFRNLFENAVKYAGEETPIHVSVELNGMAVIVRVMDEGPGIPPGHGDELFKSFSRLDNGLTRQTPGAGLGLAICKGFIQAHGGKIWLEPREHGTCVAFSLPLDEEPSLPEAIRRGNGDGRNPEDTGG